MKPVPFLYWADPINCRKCFFALKRKSKEHCTTFGRMDLIGRRTEEQNKPFLSILSISHSEKQGFLRSAMEFSKSKHEISMIITDSTSSGSLISSTCAINIQLRQAKSGFNQRNEPKNSLSCNLRGQSVAKEQTKQKRKVTVVLLREGLPPLCNRYRVE